MRNLIGWIGLQKNRLKWLLSPGGTLSQQVVRGGFWVFALRIVDRLFSLARTIVLARLLAPKDFGLFGIALLAMSALETFSETGFQQALIQQKKDIRPYLDTTWTVQVIRGSVLASILFLISPYVAAFFGEPAAAALLRVLGLSMLFQGFANIGVVYFQKELEFHKQFVYQLSGTLVDLVVAITAALLLRNAWALIFGLLAGNLVRMVASYLIHPYRPRLRLVGAKARELYGFGRWVLGSSVLIFLLTQGDDALVGKVLGATALGFYQMAYLISNLPATEITHAISQVTFPAYSKLQDDLPKLRDAYLKTLQLTAFISIPLGGGIFILGPEFVRIFLGAKWMPIVPAMQALCIFGATRSIGATIGPLFLAIGKPQIQTKLSTIQLFILAVMIYPLTIRWGIWGTSLAVVFPNIIAVALCVRAARNITKFKYTDFFKFTVIPITTASITSLVISLARNLLPESNVFSFFILVLLGTTIYLGIIYLWDNRTFLNVIRRNVSSPAIQFELGLGITNNGPLRLHLGCGDRHLEGYVNIDRRQTKSTDLVCDVRDLPYGDSSVELIESYHVIEHLPRHDLPKALREWHRILVPGGKLIIECPDFDEIVRRYGEGHERQLDGIFGLQRWEGDFHYFGYNFRRLERLLKECGFIDIREERARDYHTKEWPCLRVECMKQKATKKGCNLGEEHEIYRGESY